MVGGWELAGSIRSMKFRNTAPNWKTRLAASAVAFGLMGSGWSQEEEEVPPVIEIEPPNGAVIDVLEDLEILDADPELLEQLANVLGGEMVLGIDGGMDAAAFQGNLMIPGRSLARPMASGMVKTDSESELLLERAEQLGKQGRYDLATRLWQQAISQSSDSLLARPDWLQETYAGNTYRQMRPMLAEIEASMKRAIGDSLEDYQLKIDGDARALLARATPETRESALADVVLRFFLSSVGDDSAFELGCLKMERGEFLPAVRLFSKILDEYPKTDLDPVLVEIRLAGSLARVGSAVEALGMVDALYEKFPAYRRILTLVKADIEEVRRNQGGSDGGSATLQTPMQVQASLPALLPATLKVAWRQRFDLTLPQEWVVLPESPRSPLPNIVNQFQAQLQARNRTRVGQTQSKPTKSVRMEDRWRDFFMPAGQMLVRDGTAYFKTDDRLVACDPSSGSLKWLGFRNSLALDENTTNSTSRIRNQQMQTVPFPTSSEELLLFGDRVHQSMTLAKDYIYVLQGNPLDFQDEKVEIAPIQPNNRNRFIGRQTARGRFRENRLVAYHAVTGKLQWYRRAEEPVNPDLPITQRAGFSSSPVPYGNLLLVPVHEGPSLWLAGLDRQTGETVWRTFLCDEPAGQVQGLSPVPISLDAGDAYIGSGAGLLFSVDAISGRLNWAVDYPRSSIMVQPTNSIVPNYQDKWKLLDGHEEDRILPHGNEVIVVGTDFKYLFAVDRRSGELAWETPKTPFREPDPNAYVLAVHDGRLYVASDRSVRCYRAHGGKLLWDADLPGKSYARGAFTPGGIYMSFMDGVGPVQPAQLKNGQQPQENPQPINGIVQLDPKTGKQLSLSTIRLANDDEPIGNLYTDGERLLVYGLKQVYGLSPGDSGELLN